MNCQDEVLRSEVTNLRVRVSDLEQQIELLLKEHGLRYEHQGIWIKLVPICKECGR